MAYLGVKPAGITSATQVETDKLNVDNVQIDGNTVSSTDTNGNITLDPNGTGSVAITGGFTATDGCTITTADNSSQLTLISTDADGSSGPHLVLQRDSSSPADNDLLGQIIFRGEDDGSNVVEACEIKVTARDVTNGTEDSQFDITTQVAGTARSRMVMNEVETVFNQDSQNIDFRVESDGAANMFIVDAGANQVRMNTDGAYNSVTANVPVLHIDVNSSHSTPNTGVAVGNLASSEVGFSTMAGSSVDYYSALFHNSGATVVGSIFSTTSSTAFNTSSDHRMKENVVDMTGAITRIKQLAPKRFNFIIAPEKTVDGFLAHEAQAVVPEAVTGTHNEVDDDGNAVMQGIDQAKLVPLLTGALQEAIAKIETLETEMTALKARVTALEDA